MSIRVRAAAVQAEPMWLDLAAGVEQTIGLIEDAAAGGAELVAFPETFLPGYPWWLWLESVDWGTEFRSRYLANAMSRDSAELSAIARTARRVGIRVVLGFAERAERNLYMAQAMVSPDGQVDISRKAWPTPLERAVFAAGARTPTVYYTELGRIGMLGGADHLCPQRRMDLWREQIHVAAWSGFTIYHEVSEEIVMAVNSDVSEQYARAAGVVVIAPTALVPMIGWHAVDARTPGQRLLGVGGLARILGPDGRDLAPPLPPGSTGLLFADVVLGGSARPDADEHPSARWVG
ncbi:nitrilase-related carbon-nitrogen hydrolase [Nocardia sp. NPDC058176]|uniref:nitrilase-related carbon-nitrogen hydrolase n=1 Tax=Nocardia sp. NPDC058176 TaxID=3346368 RepID=UPI0036DDC76C